jgi:hypothetical protein
MLGLLTTDITEPGRCGKEDTETYFFMATIDVEMNPARADAFKASLHKVANRAPNLRAEVVIQSRRNKIKDTDPLTSTLCLTLRLLM